MAALPLPQREGLRGRGARLHPPGARLKVSGIVGSFKFMILTLAVSFRSLTATFSGKIEFSVVSATGEKVFRKKKSIKESDTQIGRPMFGLLAAKFIPHK